MIQGKSPLTVTRGTGTTPEPLHEYPIRNSSASLGKTVEGESVGRESLLQLPQRDLERRLYLVAVPVDERAGEAGQQLLETQSLRDDLIGLRRSSMTAARHMSGMAMTPRIICRAATLSVSGSVGKGQAGA
jgi:hypothetical protein